MTELGQGCDLGGSERIPLGLLWQEPGDYHSHQPH